MAIIELDIDSLKEHINYNSDTGKLTCVKNFFKTIIGKEIGCVSQYGYIKAKIELHKGCEI